MCNYCEILTYNCGHETVTTKPIPSSFCLFRHQGICTRELGRFRILEEYIDDWCPHCSPTAQHMRRRRDATGNFRTPFASPLELQQQQQTRSKLGTAQYVPARAPGENRLRQLNAIAGRAIQNQIQRPDSYNTPFVVWVLRYIASLPAWLDRAALAAALRPWFAELLDEQAQVCVRPALRAMQCEEYLDDVMVWMGC
ncbi:uncharacterized protein F4807DRAFT_467542 [Annulohypoxylon truncatum]|uniref:uncharacterized protein n=1 Tax=Annulohypoxylon truncatum TaxID=327061 RepID=UPI002007BBCF|nr:uncharacterized protein F4807DRAFT_467542 [Annulohypoxylon truncatum]KAI1209640.1 hypothetical protein F4807DRAFT_467542 [Annulohypoxylon truncatum]